MMMKEDPNKTPEQKYEECTSGCDKTPSCGGDTQENHNKCEACHTDCKTHLPAPTNIPPKYMSCVNKCYATD
jgi:hypothetical protein